jgi:uncharacterized protein YcaQ
MVSRGEVAVAGRKGRERLWDLAERVCPDHQVLPSAEADKPVAKRRWGYCAPPVLHGDQLVGKLDATADRTAGVLTVNAIHPDVPFTPELSQAIDAEVGRLAAWLGLALIRRQP